MSSFAAWSDNVFLRQAAESNALLSLGQPAVQLVTWRSVMRLLEQKASRSVSWRFTPKKLAKEFAESASVVVGDGMARWVTFAWRLALWMLSFFYSAVQLLVASMLCLC